MHSGARPNAHMPRINREGRNRHSHLTVLVILGLKVIRSVIWNKQKRKKIRERRESHREEKRETEAHESRSCGDGVNNESLQRH